MDLRQLEAFLAVAASTHVDCLVLDVYMPGMSGPALQEELLRRRIPVPSVFMSAQIDADTRRELIARGAVECLFKPFGGEALLEAVELAIQGR